MQEYPAEGWLMEWKQMDRQAVRFDMRSCFYYETLTSLGAKELTASFCAVDDLSYGEMSPYITWNRTQTIARGGESCNFCFFES